MCLVRTWETESHEFTKLWNAVSQFIDYNVSLSFPPRLNSDYNCIIKWSSCQLSSKRELRQGGVTAVVKVVKRSVSPQYGNNFVDTYIMTIKIIKLNCLKSSLSDSLPW